MDEKTLKEFQKWGKTPPSREAHGLEDDIRKNLRKLLPNSWKLEGNKLTGMTEVGPLVQFIPTDYICRGTDKDGLPILDKIKIQV
jgi:hypothetical protein